jgi:glycosyltransferase involved in cell wall biosynthesis
MTTHTHHQITIGVPVFNGAATIERALNSIKNQTFSNYKVVIYDNCSSDTTLALCMPFCFQDDRFKILKRDKTVHIFENWSELVNLARSEFFVLLAADDYWEPSFLEETLNVLSKNPHASAAKVRVLMQRDGNVICESNGTEAIEGRGTARIRRYLNTLPNDNSGLFGLFRTSAIRNSIKHGIKHYAGDWTFVALSLTYGPHLHIPKILHVREWEPSEKYALIVNRDNGDAVTFGFPLLPMTISILRGVNPFDWHIIFPRLARLNMIKYRENREVLARLAQSDA